MDPATLAMIMQAVKGSAQGLPDIFYGLFGNAGKPYEAAENVLNRNLPEAKGYQNPFYNMGVGAIPQFQDWLGRMKNPSDFINNLMGGYQESPFAKYQQNQAVRAATNAGSASGLTGSTPMAQFMQQNARDISSQDMNQWLQNVLGINTQYGAGLGAQVGGGQNAANQLTQLLSDFMTNKAGLRYGEEAAEQGQRGSLFSGLGKFFFGV